MHYFHPRKLGTCGHLAHLANILISPPGPTGSIYNGLFRLASAITKRISKCSGIAKAALKASFWILDSMHPPKPFSGAQRMLCAANAP